MLKEAQDSELYADILAHRLEGLKAEGGPPPQQIQQAPTPPQPSKGETPKEDEVLSGLSAFDRQRLLTSEPKSLNERMLKKLLQASNGSNKKEANSGI